MIFGNKLRQTRCLASAFFDLLKSIQLKLIGQSFEVTKAIKI